MSVLKNVPALGRREQNKADKLRRIEDAARALFAEQGYEETSTRAIAERAGIAAGTLFTYFPEKRLLLIHVVRSAIDEAIEEALATLPAVPSDPVAALEHLFGAIYGAYEEDPRLSRVFVKEVLFVDGELGVELSSWTLAFVARLGGILDGWRRAGVLGAHVEPATAAYQIFALYYFGLVSWLGGSAVTSELRDTLFRASLVQLLHGLAPSPDPTTKGRRR
jgi:AcrR family transcriptional regulator